MAAKYPYGHFDGPSDDEESEATDKVRQRKVMQGHAEDSRFDYGKGVDSDEVKVTRPSDHFTSKHRSHIRDSDKESLNRGYGKR